MLRRTPGVRRLMWMDGATDRVLCAACAICGERSVECVVCAIYDEREGSTGSRYTYSGAYQCMRVFLLNDYYIQRYTGAHAHTFAHTFSPAAQKYKKSSFTQKKKTTDGERRSPSRGQRVTDRIHHVRSRRQSHRTGGAPACSFRPCSPFLFRVVIRPESSRPRGQSAGRPSRRHSRGLRAPPPRRRRRGVIRGRRR